MSYQQNRKEYLDKNLLSEEDIHQDENGREYHVSSNIAKDIQEIVYLDEIGIEKVCILCGGVGELTVPVYDEDSHTYQNTDSADCPDCRPNHSKINED